MNRALASIMLTALMLSAVLAFPQGAVAVTDDQCEMLTPSTATVMGLYEVRMRLAIGSLPISDGSVRVTVPDGWSLPQTANSSSEGFTEVVMSYGAFGSVASVSCTGRNITATVTGAQPGDIIYVKYGSGGLALAPFQLGNYSFSMEVSRGAGFEPVTGSPMVLPVVTGGFSGFRMLLPGESAAEGTLEGKTGTPLPISTGMPFFLTVQTVDAGNNLVPMNSSGEYLLLSSDLFKYPPTGLITGLNFASGEATALVTFNLAGANELRIVNATMVNVTALEVDVAPGAPVGLQVLVPGVSAAPGDTASGGDAGTPSPWIAGIPYPFEVRAVDAYWNVNGSVSGPVSVRISAGNATVAWHNGTLSQGIALFETTLVAPVSHNLSASAPLLPTLNMTLPVQRIGRLLAIEGEVTAEIGGGAYGPFSVRIVDNLGQPFAGANVSFAFASAPAGFSLDPAYAVTGADGIARTYATTGAELGAFTVLASCGSVPGSPLSLTLSVVDVTEPVASITTSPGTVGPLFAINATAQDFGGGQVSSVDLYYRTGLVWFRHSSLASPPWLFPVNWTLGSGDVDFGVLASDDQGNVQREFAEILALTVDADAPMLLHSDLPAYSKTETINVTVTLNEEIGQAGDVLLDGKILAGLALSFPDASSVSFSLDLENVGWHSHILTLANFTDVYGNVMEEINAGTVIVDGFRPHGAVYAELPPDGKPLGAGSVPLSWWFTDGLGLASSVEIRVNGEPIAVDGPVGAAVVAVPEGADSFLVEFTAVDNAGYVRSGSVGPVSVDRIAPEVSSLDFYHIPPTGDWHFTLSASDANGLASAYLLYRAPGQEAFSSVEMTPADGGFALLTSLGGLKDAEVMVKVMDGASPPNVACHPSTGTIRITAPERPALLGHSPPSHFIPGKELTLTLRCDFDAESAVLHWGQGAGYASMPMSGSFGSWKGTLSPDALAILEYYFIVEGPDGALTLDDSGSPYRLEPRVPSASLAWSSPRAGVLELVFPVPMDRASVEAGLTAPSGALVSWRGEGDSDVLVVDLGPESGERSVTVDAGATTNDGYSLESDFTVVSLAPDGEGEAGSPCLALGVVAIALFLLLAAAGVGLRFSSERGRIK